MADRAPLHDYSSSRAVVMGTWEYRHLPPVPAAGHSFRRMRTLLTGPLCDWPKSRTLTLENEPGPGDLADQLVTAFEDVRGIALFYYVGHGQIDAEDQLCLGLVGSRAEYNRRAGTSLRFHAVRQALLDSPAAMKLVILDCCFAGLASRPGNTLSAGEIADLTAGTGACVLAATSADSTAWYETKARVRQPQTYFTRYLADLVEAGIPGQPDGLKVHPLFVELKDRLARDRLPVPVERSIDAARDFIFARNAAPPGTREDPELRRLARQLAEAEARSARDSAGARARELELRAEIAQASRELQELRARAGKGEPESAGKQVLLQAVIQEAERELHETSADHPGAGGTSGREGGEEASSRRRPTWLRRWTLRGLLSLGAAAAALAIVGYLALESGPGASAFSGFSGQWTGQVRQSGSPGTTLTVKITLSGKPEKGAAFYTDGTSVYCTGLLFQDSLTAGSAVLHQEIDGATAGSCGWGTVTLRAAGNGKVTYSFQGAGVPGMTGALKKQG
jgi:hypothetical protein